MPSIVGLGIKQPINILDYLDHLENNIDPFEKQLEKYLNEYKQKAQLNKKEYNALNLLIGFLTVKCNVHEFEQITGVKVSSKFHKDLFYGENRISKAKKLWAKETVKQFFEYIQSTYNCPLDKPIKTLNRKT